MTALTRSLWPSTLEKRGVELVDREAALHGNIQLQCKKCGKSWEPRLQSGGRLPSGYWECPNGCNSVVK